MRRTESLVLLKNSLQSFFTTREAASVLGQTAPSTTKILQLLAGDGLIRQIRHGCWTSDVNASPLAYAAWVAAPLPSYISLYTALFYHGIIQQIPQTIYVVSLGKTDLIRTELGEYSIHQISPILFRGYTDQGGVRMGTPEKTIFDMLYFERATSGKFVGMTETELPTDFDREEVFAYLNLIVDLKVRSRLLNAIQAFFAKIDE
jgi:predicted transcriptional regulator of viral defense system